MVSRVGALAHARARARETLPLGNNKCDNTFAGSFGPDNDPAMTLKNHKQPVIIPNYRERSPKRRNRCARDSSGTSNAVARFETTRTGEGRKTGEKGGERKRVKRSHKFPYISRVRMPDGGEEGVFFEVK